MSGHDLDGGTSTTRLTNPDTVDAVVRAHRMRRDRLAGMKLAVVVQEHHPDDPHGPCARADLREVLLMLGLAKPPRKVAKPKTSPIPPKMRTEETR